MSKKINSYYFTLLKALIIHKMEGDFEATLSVKNRRVLAKSMSMSETYITKFFNSGYEGNKKTPSNPKMATIKKLLDYLHEDIECDSWEEFTKKFYQSWAINCDKTFYDLNNTLKNKVRKAVVQVVDSVYKLTTPPIKEEFIFSKKHQYVLGVVILLILLLLSNQDYIYMFLHAIIERLPSEN